MYINKKLNILMIAMVGLITLPVLVSAAPKDDQETDQIDKKLRVTNDKGEIDEYKATIAEVLVSKNEAKAMTQLNKLLGKYRGSPLEPGLLFRKAELFVRQSKSARFFEFTKADDHLLTMMPPTMKSASSKGKVQDAIKIYEEIQKKYPNYSELDTVLFNNAFLRQELGETKTVEKIYKIILKDFSESILIPDTHMALAEMYYQQRRYDEAMKDYEAIKQFPLSRVYPYAVYKEGWTKYQVKDVVGAVKELETVIDISQKFTAQENAKLNLKTEALNDLVLFYPEAYPARNAFAYFKKLAGDDAGKYLIQLSQLYERHSNFQDLEVVLNDLISSLPQSQDTSVAYRSLIENDLTARNYDKATGHLAKFENHCKEYFPTDNIMDPKNKVKFTALAKLPAAKQTFNADDEDDISDKNCFTVLSKESLKLAVKWHAGWQKKSQFAEKEHVSKSDWKTVDSIADATELAYSIFLRNTPDSEKKAAARFAYAELLFQRKKFRMASDEYYKTAIVAKDPKILSESSYFAIVSLESAVGDKWNDQDEEAYVRLAKVYIEKNPNGKFVNDIRFKKAFIAYEKGRYEEALPEFHKIGWSQIADEKLVVKSQDLYLDILNLQKKYKELAESTEHLMSLKITPERKAALLKINRESNFAYAVELEQKGDLDTAVAVYDKFAHQNSDSKLADKALWNEIQILIKKNQLKNAADKSFELSKMFVSSEFTKPALKKAAELYEYLADTGDTALALKSLSRIDVQDSLKWEKLSADFFVLSGDFKKGVDIYKEILKKPDEVMRKDVVAKLVRIDASSANTSKEVKDLIAKYGDEKYSEQNLNQAQMHFDNKDFTVAFKLASQIVGDKTAPYDAQAKARFIQAEILKDEFVKQSVKSKVDRLQLVLTMKTEKLDKAQRAYQATVKYGDPVTTLKAFYSLAKMYEHYVAALHDIKITDEISDKDRKALMAEIDQILMPIEEKVADTLQQGLDFAKKHPAYDGYAFELRNELNRVNFKGTKYVKYEVMTPPVALPSSE